MKGTLKLVGVLVLFLGLTVGACATEDPFRQAMILDQVMEMKSELNLTEDQIQSLVPIVERNMYNVWRLMQEKMGTAAMRRREEQIAQEYIKQLSGVLKPQQLDTFLSGRSAARLPANDALAKARLRTISTAAETFATVHSGQYPLDIDALTYAQPPYLNESPCGKTISGFLFTCHFTATGYSVEAAPEHPGTSGSRIFTIETGGVLTP